MEVHLQTINALKSALHQVEKFSSVLYSALLSSYCIFTTKNAYPHFYIKKLFRICV